MFPCMAGIIFEGICSSLAEIYNIEIWKNSPCFIMGGFRCQGNVRYAFRIDAIFCKVHSIGPSNMCIHFEKNRLRIDDFKKSEKKSYVFFYVVQKRAKTWRRMLNLLKSYGPLCDFHKSDDLDLDLDLDLDQNKYLPRSQNMNKSAVKKSGRSDQYSGLYILLRRTNIETDKPRWPIYFAKIYDFAE